VQPGQYILSVKATDTAGKNEKILILNVDNAFTTFSSPPATQPAPTAALTQSTSSASSASASSSLYSTDYSTNISSISALFQSGSSSQYTDAGVSSVDSLQNYFNGIDTSGGSVQTGPSIGSSLSQILTDFSNTSTLVAVPTDATPSAQTIVSQNSINLNFNNSQKSTVSTAEATLLFAAQKQASEWVAGNYSVVLQLTADKNSLNSLISSLTQQYQQDQQAQKTAADELNAAANNKSKIDSAISNLNALLNNIASQMSASTAKLAQLQTQKQALIIQASQTQSTSQQISQTIINITSQIQSTNASLTANSKTCDSFSSSLL
jgi:hypothetical protein